MPAIREFFASLGLDVDEQSFAVGELAAKGVEKAFDFVKEKLSEVVDGFFEAINASVESAARLSDLSVETGISAERLQELSGAAALSGVSMDQMVHGLTSLSRSALAASQGVEESSRAFRQVGVSVMGSNGHLKTADELLLGIADKFSEMKDPTARAALAMQLLGHSGAALVPFLSEGREGVEEFVKQAEALGIVTSEDDVKALAKYGAQMKLAQAAMDGFRDDLVLRLLPALRSGLTRALDWWGKHRKAILGLVDVIAQDFVPLVKGALMVAMGLLTAALVTNFGAVITTIGWYGALGIAAVVNAAKAAASWLLAAAPFVIIAVLVAGLLLILEDLWVTAHGGEGIMTDLFAKWTVFIDDFLRVRGDEWWLTRWIKTAFKALGDLQGTYEEGKKQFTRDQDKKALEVDAIPDGWYKRYFVHRPADELLSPNLRMGGGAVSPAASVVVNTQAGTAPSPKRPADANGQPAAPPPAIVSPTVNIGDITVHGSNGDPQDIANRIADTVSGRLYDELSRANASE